MILMYSAIVLYDSVQGKVLVGYYLLKNSQAVKKGVALYKIVSMNKVVKYRWQPRNGCDDRSVTNILTTIIQVNLCSLILGISTKFT